MNTTNTISNTDNTARYWSFEYSSKSPEALRLTTTLFSSLKLNVGEKNKLSERQLTTRFKAFDRCLSSLVAQTRLNEGQQLYRALTKGSFDAYVEVVSHNNFRLVTDALIAKGYLLHTPGKLYPEEDFDYPDGSKAPLIWTGKASHYTPTLKLLKLVRKYGLKKKGLLAHFDKDKPKWLVDARWASMSNGRTKIRGGRVARSIISKDPSYKSHMEEMKVINDYLFKQRLEGGEFAGLKRSFNNYTSEGYNWDAGGRMYDIGQGGYQKLAKEERAKMTINGEPVVEIDIEACFLSILLGLMNQPLPNENLYSVGGLQRPIVKSWMTISLTNGKMLVKWPSKALRSLEKDLPGVKIPTASKVKEAVLGRYPWLERLSDEGIGWPKLQHVESTIMKQTIKELAHMDIPAYPVHDSLIVPQSKRNEAKQLLDYWFLAKTGVRARID